MRQISSLLNVDLRALNFLVLNILVDDLKFSLVRLSSLLASHGLIPCILRNQIHPMLYFLRLIDLVMGSCPLNVVLLILIV